MTTNTTVQKPAIDLFSMVLTALFAAILCVLAPFSIPIGPVPITLATMIILISVYVLGWQKATIACLLYLILGCVGLPVFSGFEGGIGKLAGPTGGYLVGYLFLSAISGLFIEKWDKLSPLHVAMQVLGMIAGTAILYLFGTAWFCISTGTGVIAALSLCVFPFLIGDGIKIAIAAIVGPMLRKLIATVHRES